MATPNAELLSSLAKRKAAQEAGDFKDPRTLPSLLPPPPLAHDVLLPTLAAGMKAEVIKAGSESGALLVSGSTPTLVGATDASVELSVVVTTTAAAVAAAPVKSAAPTEAAASFVCVEAWTVLAVEQYIAATWTSFLSSYTPSMLQLQLPPAGSGSSAPAGAAQLSASAASCFGLPGGSLLIPRAGPAALSLLVSVRDLAPETAFSFRARTGTLQLSAVGRVALRKLLAAEAASAEGAAGASAAATSASAAPSPMLGLVPSDFALAWSAPSADSPAFKTLSKEAHASALARAALTAAAVAEEAELLAAARGEGASTSAKLGSSSFKLRRATFGEPATLRKEGESAPNEGAASGGAGAASGAGSPATATAATAAAASAAGVASPAAAQGQAAPAAAASPSAAAGSAASAASPAASSGGWSISQLLFGSSPAAASPAAAAATEAVSSSPPPNAADSNAAPA